MDLTTTGKRLKQILRLIGMKHQGEWYFYLTNIRDKRLGPKDIYTIYAALILYMLVKIVIREAARASGLPMNHFSFKRSFGILTQIIELMYLRLVHEDYELERLIECTCTAFFLELLKAKRRRMKPVKRRQSRSVKRGSLPAWLYPFAVERRYRRGITERLQEITGLGADRVRSGLKGWLAEANRDGLRVDEWTDEIQDLIHELEEASRRIFVESSTEVVNWLKRIAVTISDWDRKQAVKQIKHVLGEGSHQRLGG